MIKVFTRSRESIFNEKREEDIGTVATVHSFNNKSQQQNWMEPTRFAK